ncbi:uncharacterized protein LOC106178668 [Lingula anatina]|uniref:Uncharacterized protein LOC106178668 n=1 Tax=Lingula anatina TaxID=7574 RepID=A0A1S3K442_LINAN|nr:uncharacterized protein LOC106178668 [Lingula anatina]|eukprot:XP_013417403.1 uncharacterized protein LOC106178668 [Lingula anatina]
MIQKLLPELTLVGVLTMTARRSAKSRLPPAIIYPSRTFHILSTTKTRDQEPNGKEFADDKGQTVPNVKPQTENNATPKPTQILDSNRFQPPWESALLSSQELQTDAVKPKETFKLRLRKDFNFSKEMYLKARNIQSDDEKEYIVQELTKGFELIVDKNHESNDKPNKDKEISNKLDKLLKMGCTLADILEYPYVLQYVNSSIDDRHERLQNANLHVHPLGLTWASGITKPCCLQHYAAMGNHTSLMSYLAEKLGISLSDIVPEHFKPLKPVVDMAAMDTKLTILRRAGCTVDLLKAKIDQVNMLKVDQVQEWFKKHEEDFKTAGNLPALLTDLFPVDFIENYFKIPHEEIQRHCRYYNKCLPTTARHRIDLPFVQDALPEAVLDQGRSLLKASSERLETAYHGLVRERIWNNISMKEVLYQTHYKHLPIIKRSLFVYIKENEELYILPVAPATWPQFKDKSYLRTDRPSWEIRENFSYLKSKGFNVRDIEACLFILDIHPTILSKYVEAAPSRAELQPYTKWEKTPQRLLNAILYLSQVDKNFSCLQVKKKSKK